MDSKNNFIFYTEYYDSLKLLTYEQKGQLLDALCLFQMGEDVPELDSITNMAFTFISSDMKRNNEKYCAIAQKRREAGSKGGKIAQANQANAYFASSKQANQANASNSVSVNVSVSDKDSDSDKESDVDSVSVSDKEGDDASQTNTPDTPEKPNAFHVIKEAAENGYTMTASEAKKFLEYNEAHNWKLEWKYALKRWLDQEQQRPRGKPKLKNDVSEKHNYSEEQMAELRRRAKE